MIVQDDDGRRIKPMGELLLPHERPVMGDVKLQRVTLFHSLYSRVFTASALTGRLIAIIEPACNTIDFYSHEKV